MKEAQQCISSREFAEWKAYDLIDPIGDYRGDVQAAMIVQALHNRSRAQDEPVRAIEEFLPRFGESEE